MPICSFEMSSAAVNYTGGWTERLVHFLFIDKAHGKPNYNHRVAWWEWNQNKRTCLDNPWLGSTCYRDYLGFPWVLLSRKACQCLGFEDLISMLTIFLLFSFFPNQATKYILKNSKHNLGLLPKTEFTPPLEIFRDIQLLCLGPHVNTHFFNKVLPALSCRYFYPRVVEKVFRYPRLPLCY